MIEWDEVEWRERVRKAKNMDEVRELMKDIPQNDISSALTDDPMSTFTALRMIVERSKHYGHSISVNAAPTGGLSHSSLVPEPYSGID